MSTNDTVYEVNLPDLTTSELLLDLVGKLGAKLSGEITTEQTARLNADSAINNLITMIDGRVTTLEQKPDELTDGERQVIEEALERLVQQEGFSSLIGGMNVTIGGVNYSASSVILAMLAARKIKRHDYSNRVGYLPRTYTVTFTDDTASVFNATATDMTAAALTAMLGRQIDNPGASYLFETADFGGIPASFSFAYEHVPVGAGGVTSTQAILLRKSNIVALLPGFTTSTPVTLAGVDMNGDNIIGEPVVVPVADPIAAAFAVLTAAIAALTQAQTDAAAAAAAVPVKTGAKAAADTALVDAQAVSDDTRPDAVALVQTKANALTAAQDAVVPLVAADSLAAQELAAAQQILDDAFASGDPVQIAAAQETVNTETTERNAAAAALASAQTAVQAASQEYGAAVSALSAIDGALTAAQNAAQTAADELAAAQSLASSTAAAVVAATTARDEAQTAYDAVNV
jgi:hypothetical protein